MNRVTSIRQTHKGVNWEVTPVGGYITRLSQDETDLLFPDSIINGTRRGGMFAAVPNFGPDKRNVDNPLAQHGYARTSNWHVGRIAAAGVSLSHERMSGQYAGLCTSLSYGFNSVPEHASTTLFAGLKLTNRSHRVMRIAPAFHPYIDLSRLGESSLQQAQRSLGNSPTVPATQATLAVSDTEEVHIATKGFERVTWWTDSLGKYVCIEPSLAGDSFSEFPDDPLDVEILEPGEVRKFDMTLTWKPKALNITSRRS